MISIQTNIDSLIAQQNLGVNSQFQSNTIQQLTSGYRINSSADDAAGLSVANGYRNSIAQLNQGVLNANQGVSQLQIVDGGLSNISQMLDRLQTLATESASDTFIGSRATLNGEYQGLLTEIDRQASNIGLSATNSLNNSNLQVYIGGGGSQQGDAQVSVDLSGAGKQVDSAGLGLAGTDVLGGIVGGVEFEGAATLAAGATDNPSATMKGGDYAATAAGGVVPAGQLAQGVTAYSGTQNLIQLNNPNTKFLDTSSTQNFTFNYVDSTGATQSRSVQVSGGALGVTGTQVITQLNSGLAGTGITADISNDGTLEFSSNSAFTAGAGAKVGTGVNGVTTGAATLVNTSQYNVTKAFTLFSAAGTPAETFTVSDGSNSADITLNRASADNIGDAVSSINSALQKAGITDVHALQNGDGTQISFQGTANFSIVESAYAANGGTGSLFGATGAVSVTPTQAAGGTAGTDALSAIAAITAAVSKLGLVQGVVGAGENKLNYAVNLAQSQITSFSAAQSQIRDANVAAEAANLTKAQVLQQASIAAMAQANQEPQAVLALLKQ